MTDFETLNLNFIESNYRIWKTRPDDLPADWRFFFLGFEMAEGQTSVSGPACDERSLQFQSRVDALIHRYRDIGHLLACMDPLSACPVDHPLLNPAAFGLNESDMNQAVQPLTQPDGNPVPLRQVIHHLKETYCRSIGVEYMHVQDPDERAWLQNRMEPVQNQPNLNPDDRNAILFKLVQAAGFEQFLNKTYVGVTRFSLEGGDLLIPLLDRLFSHAVQSGCREIVMGMAHRGRLNVLAHILEKPYASILSEFENCYDPTDLSGSGDVKYHNGWMADVTRNGHPLRLFLVPNPSHLEAVNPVVEGLCRARQDQTGHHGRNQIWPVLIHGDAAFAGQGIVAETLNMSQLAGYATGGAIHIVINNQIGYTTLPGDARSSRYATDVAKMLMVPIFHVHGENPEAAAQVISIAADYKMTFNKDVLIDLVCYRRYGHNEGDDPYFTQPRMVERIKLRQAPYRLYGASLVERSDIGPDAIAEMEAAIQNQMESAYQDIHGSVCPFPMPRFYENWNGYGGNWSHEAIDTGVDAKALGILAEKLNQIPDGFTVHPKLTAILKKRGDAVQSGQRIDWANAESLAFASIVSEGHAIRLSGQDVGRGTFSQRHCVLTDTKNDNRHIPLQSVCSGSATFSVYDSMLAEASILGFEYGYSLVSPESLILWEAQFGDFVNNAQSVIDLFIASGESKWQRLSGLTLLLPHGMEGLGPEHSSARPERFLELCANHNMVVCNPTTPAQYFHLLRRQITSRVKKPLVILTPKSLLRHPVAMSNLADLTSGTFQPILADPDVSHPARVLICSGKVYYDLLDQRNKADRPDISLIRMEQVYPFHEAAFKEIVQSHTRAPEWFWVQEEPENMGAWRFVRPIIEDILGRPVTCISRPASPSPATGFPKIYQQQKKLLLEAAVGGEKID